MPEKWVGLSLMPSSCIRVSMNFLKTMNAKFPKMPKSLFRPPPGFKKPKVSDFKEDMQNLGESIAEEFKDTIKENIEGNFYGFTLAESTIKRKGSDIPLIDSRELIDAIFREGTTVSVEDSQRSDSGLTNLELAMVHEYGTKDKHIPARPVWRYTYRDFKVEAKKTITEFFYANKNKSSR